MLPILITRRLTAARALPRYTVPFPDLSTTASPCTCGFGPTPARTPQVSQGLIVSHLHKSTYQVLSRSEIQYAGRKV